MRKIESQMVAAIQGNQNWTNGNTCVTFDPDSGESTVFLHGNKIATVLDDSMVIWDGGYQSNTTKSRLNALCSAFGYAGECVFQQDWKWYVRRWVGGMNGQSLFAEVDFYNGYVFAG